MNVEASSVTEGMRNVMCVCDDPDLIEEICQALAGERFAGYVAAVRAEVDEASSVDQADVFLVDEALGAVDNWNISRRIRSRCEGREIVVLALVKELGSDLLAQVRGLGLDGFIRKEGMRERLAPGLAFLARNIPERERTPHGEFKSFRALLQILPSWDGGHFPQEGTRDPTAPLPRPRRSDTKSVRDLVSFLSSEEDVVTNKTIVINDLDDVPAEEEAFEGTIPDDSARIILHEQGAADEDVTIMSDLRPETAGLRRERTARVEDHLLERELVGKMLGKVRLEELIGAGAGGAVYRGHHTNLDLPVAVKVLHAALAQQDSDYALRFLAEARMAARISHANVVRMLDCDRDDGRTNCYYIVMEFVGGKSLGDEIKDRGTVPEARLMGMAIGITHALVAASKHDVIHRDIKPENILLDEDGMVKVADLGLAKRTQKLAGLGTTKMRTRFDELTKRDEPMENAAIVGTPHYMAPESITDPARVDMRADIYSLGATLYHALTGRTMFEASRARDILMHQVNDMPPSPHQVNEKVSKQLSKIIMRMLAKDPAQRPPSHLDMLGAFRAHRDAMLIASGSKGKGLTKIYRKFTRG